MLVPERTATNAQDHRTVPFQDRGEGSFVVLAEEAVEQFLVRFAFAGRSDRQRANASEQSIRSLCRHLALPPRARVTHDSARTQPSRHADFPQAETHEPRGNPSRLVLWRLAADQENNSSTGLPLSTSFIGRWSCVITSLSGSMPRAWQIDACRWLTFTGRSFGSIASSSDEPMT